MTRREDISLAQTLGVDAIGFIFAAESPRCVSISQVKQLLRPSPLFMDTVAVLVNPDVAFVEQILQELPIQWLQFHGEESPEFCEQFNHPYIKAIPAVSTAVIHQAVKNYAGASAILLDTPSSSYRGGSGESFDWHIIPHNLEKPIILAGGLNPLRARQAVSVYKPYAVDVNSGVELSPGIKDHEKMALFVQAIGGR